MRLLHRTIKAPLLLWRNLARILPLHLLALYGLSALVPRSRDLWVFGTWEGRAFADNAKYFYLYCHRQEQGPKVVWISRNPALVAALRAQGFNAAYLFGVQGVWHCLRAGRYVFTHQVDDIGFWLSARARKLNLWHGIPLKRINHDNPRDRKRFPENRWRRLLTWVERLAHEKPDHLAIATSPAHARLMASALRLPSTRVLVTGYPRNDRLLNADYSLSEQPAWTGNEPLVLFMPTFQNEADERNSLSSELFEALEQVVSAHGARLALKLHPRSRLADWLGRQDLPSLTIIPPDADPYPWAASAAVLITDYSSILFDFLLLDRPLVFYSPDREAYIQRSRGLYVDYDAFVPGPIAETPEGCARAVAAALSGENDGHADQRRQLRQTFFTFHDGQASQRLLCQLLTAD